MSRRKRLNQSGFTKVFANTFLLWYTYVYTVIVTEKDHAEKSVSGNHQCL